MEGEPLSSIPGSASLRHNKAKVSGTRSSSRSHRIGDCTSGGTRAPYSNLGQKSPEFPSPCRRSRIRSWRSPYRPLHAESIQSSVLPNCKQPHSSICRWRPATARFQWHVSCGASSTLSGAVLTSVHQSIQAPSRRLQTGFHRNSVDPHIFNERNRHALGRAWRSLWTNQPRLMAA